MTANEINIILGFLVIFAFFFMVSTIVGRSVIKDMKNELEEKEKEISKEGRKIINRFIIMCDGIPPYMETMDGMPTTWQIGLCSLSYEDESNTLVIGVRRPGILIGKAGTTYDKIRKELGVNLKIHEVIFGR